MSCPRRMRGLEGITLTRFVLTTKKCQITSRLSSPNVIAGSSVTALPSKLPICLPAWQRRTDCHLASNANWNEMGRCRRACKSEFSHWRNSAVPDCRDYLRTGCEFLWEPASSFLIQENALWTYFGCNKNPPIEKKLSNRMELTLWSLPGRKSAYLSI